MTDYAHLAQLSERALALAEAGELDALAACDEEIASLAAALPDRPPPAAREHLERAAALQAARTAALARQRKEVVDGMRRLSGGRRTARSYAPSAPASAHLVDRAG